MNYYPFNIGDYAAHTGHLEPMEDLIYRRLLDAYYLREGALPADIQTTAKLIRLRSMAADVESVLREFFTLSDDGWTHARCDEEIAKMQDKQAKARDAAELSVKSRRAAAERRLAEEQAAAERALASAPTDVQLPTPTPTPTPVLIPPVVEAVGDDKPKARGSRLPADWTLPDEWRAWAKAERPDLDPDRTGALFRDYWVAKAGASASKLDWPATWRNWVREQRAGPHQRAAQATAEPDWRREQRERMQQAAPYAVASRQRTPQSTLLETDDVLPLARPAA